KSARGEGIIEFYDPLHPPDSTDVFAKREKIVTKTAAGLNMYISVTPTSTITIIMDEMSGDHLKVKGTADFNVNKDPNGQLNVVGNYLVEDGEYILSIAGVL